MMPECKAVWEGVERDRGIDNIGVLSNNLDSFWLVTYLLQRRTLLKDEICRKILGSLCFYTISVESCDKNASLKEEKLYFK